MLTPLWTSAEIAEATGGRASADFEVTGVTFDSREVKPGDLFIAMPGTVHDGHKFVEGALGSGAQGVLVSQPVDGQCGGLMRFSSDDGAPNSQES